MKSVINVVSFATKRFEKSQKILEEKCYEFGASKVFSYKTKDIEPAFVRKNKKAFSCARGAGLWIWKPYVINKALKETQQDEILFYIDSGAYPIADLDNLIFEENISCFEMYDQYHKDWTKYDCFHVMNCTEDKFKIPKQCLGGFQIYKNNDQSNAFVEEYLHFCEKEENICITDEKSKYGKEVVEFKENRHDQSVFTNLCIKYDIPRHRDPSQWGNNFVDKYEDTYPQIFNLHRGKV